jgi:recombinational DNA repair protein RecR
MNEEYLRAKFNLCLDQAEKNIKEEDIANAIKNLERANSALSRIFNLEEEVICTFCNDNSKSCRACDDNYEGE